MFAALFLDVALFAAHSYFVILSPPAPPNQHTTMSAALKSARVAPATARRCVCVGEAAGGLLPRTKRRAAPLACSLLATPSPPALTPRPIRPPNSNVTVAAVPKAVENAGKAAAAVAAAVLLSVSLCLGDGIGGVIADPPAARRAPRLSARQAG